MSDTKNELMRVSGFPAPSVLEEIRYMERGTALDISMERSYYETPAMKTGVSVGKFFLGVEYGGKPVHETCRYIIKKL